MQIITNALIVASNEERVPITQVPAPRLRTREWTGKTYISQSSSTIKLSLTTYAAADVVLAITNVYAQPGGIFWVTLGDSSDSLDLTKPWWLVTARPGDTLVIEELMVLDGATHLKLMQWSGYYRIEGEILQ